jgi:hypothetical protein
LKPGRIEALILKGREKKTATFNFRMISDPFTGAYLLTTTPGGMEKYQVGVLSRMWPKTWERVHLPWIKQAYPQRSSMISFAESST